LTNIAQYAIIKILQERKERRKMAMMIYLDGKCVGVASGCEFVGEVWVQTQRLAELLCVDCALVSAETGEVLVLWEP
jgi:hypothetical protein